MMRARSLRALPVAGLLALLATACSGASANTGCPPGDVSVGVPPALGGLSVLESPGSVEKILAEQAEGNTYVCTASVFELRDGPTEDDELRGVFTVIRMTEDARVDDIEFLRTIAVGVSGVGRVPERITDALVWKGESNQQLFFVWFHDEFMQLLVIRNDPGSAILKPLDVDRLLAEAISLRAS